MAIVSVWTAQKPDAALKWILGLSAKDRFRGLQFYMQSLIMKDPSRALDAMARPEFSESFMGQWIGRVIATDVKSANATVDRLPPGRGRSAVICGIASSLSGDPEAALAWANTLLPGERDAAVGELFQVLGWSDPEAALGLASTKLDGPMRKTALTSIIRGWATKDYDAAFAGRTKIDDWVRGLHRTPPERTPAQLRQLQFHCGKPPPAAEPRTLMRTVREVWARR